MRPADWDARVRTAQGREPPARQVPWLRTREVWVHAVDLATGTTVADLPAALVDALLDDATAGFTARGDCRCGWRRPTGPGPGGVGGDAGDPSTLSNRAADLLGWLTGRTGQDRLTGPVPELPAWL